MISYGFVKLAVKHGYTIMRFGMVSPDEFYGHLIKGQDIPDMAVGELLRRMGFLTDDTRSDMLPPIPVGAMGTIMPKPQRCDVGFGEPVDLASYKGACLPKSSNRVFAPRLRNSYFYAPRAAGRVACCAGC